MKKIIYLFALFSCWQIVMAQQDSSYLPLQVGNYWVLVGYEIGGYPYPMYSRWKITKDTVMTNNVKYFLLTNITNHFYRQAENGDILEYYPKCDKEILVYPFSKKVSCSDSIENISESNCYVGKRLVNIVISDSIFQIGLLGRSSFKKGFGPCGGNSDFIVFSIDTAIVNGICLTCNPQIGVEETKMLPNDISLLQNYPNPFNPTTNISFELKSRSKVKLTIFDLLGKIIDIPINSLYESGKHQITWDANNRKKEKIGSGVYYYQLEAINLNTNQKSIITKKMLLQK
jgi:hypothetical protein